MLIRCSKESQHPAEWALGLRLSSPREQEKHNVTVITVGSKYYSLYSVSSSLSHANPTQPFWNLTNKVRGKYICKEVFLRLCHCVCLYYACVCLIIVSLWYDSWECNKIIQRLKRSASTNWRENSWIHTFPKYYVKCRQLHPEFELGSLCPFPTKIIHTPWSCLYSCSLYNTDQGMSSWCNG